MTRNVLSRADGVVLEQAFFKSLVLATPGQVWQKYFLPGSKKPVIVKIRHEDVDLLEDGQELVFTALAYEPEGCERSERARIDYLVLRLHPPDPNRGDTEEPLGVLKLFTAPRDVNSHILIGECRFAVPFVGTHENCMLYVEDLGDQLEPKAVTRDREVLVEDTAFLAIQALNGNQIRRLGSDQLNLGEIVVYDHRSDQTTYFGYVQQVRDSRNVYFLIFDIPESAKVAKFVLTQTGLMVSPSGPISIGDFS